MLVEIDRQGDILLQERSPEISDAPVKNLVDIKVLIELLLRAVATVCRVERTEVVEHFSRASGIVIIVDVDVVSVIFDLIIQVHPLVFKFHSLSIYFCNQCVHALHGAQTLFMPLISPSVPGAKRRVTSRCHN